MIVPDAILVTLIALPGTIAAVIVGWLRNRNDARLSQAQILATQIERLSEDARAMDLRIDAANDKLQTARENVLKCESERNILADQLARCTEIRQRTEEERQRLASLALDLRRQLGEAEKPCRPKQEREAS